MNTLLWTLQIVLAAVFAGAGATKLVQSRDHLAKTLGGWVDDFPAPLLMYYLAKGSEFFGGLFLFIGIFTRVAGGLVAFTMLVATLTANLHSIYDGDGAITISFFLFALLFVFIGPGKWSIGYLLLKDKLKGLLV